MPIQAMALECLALLDSVGSTDALSAAMTRITMRLGFRYFALAHQGDGPRVGDGAVQLDNFPARWRACYEREALDRCDPVRRSSQATTGAFTWAQLPGLITLNAAERDFLARLHGAGIGDGYTVPAFAASAATGSCSFAIAAGMTMPSATLPLAHVIASAALEAVRNLRLSYRAARPLPALTARQRHCVLWAARGKSDWEISRILDISPETVTRHLKQARERYGVQKRTSLVIRALFDGSLSFSEVLAH